VKIITHIVFVFVFLGLPLQGYTQAEAGEQLAAQYYQNREYDKALDYYEKLYYKTPSPFYYQQYFNCLVKTKQFDKAEKLVKKLLKQYPEKTSYWIDLGINYQAAEDTKKMQKAWERGIDETKYDEQILAVAKSFMDIQQYDYAIKTYLKGRRISENGYPFNMELAEAYKAKGDKTAMINEYLNLLDVQEAYLQSVQGALQMSIGSESDAEKNNIIKTELLKRIQHSPDKTIYSELLIWFQQQQGDYEGAFIQAKALDKRKREQGHRVMALAQLFTQAENYDMAAQAYQYVIEKGVSGPYYMDARMEILNVKYQKIITQNNYTSTELTELEVAYGQAIQEFGRSSATASLFKNLAHVQAFYLHKTDEAIALLASMIEQPVLAPNVQAQFKLELGDILLLSGDIWEASLRYSQVEKAFKYDEVGQEAKFRNAKVAYYTYDFKWAQAQLDVLKGATAKLIANDAMQLSLLISDALAADSNEVPLQLFARADLQIFQNKDTQALLVLDSISTLFPSHSLVANVLYKKAEIAIKRKHYADAVVFFESIVKNFDQGIWADDALFKIAELNEFQIKNTEKAKQLYQQLIEEYPGSLYVVEARKRFRKLRGDGVN
jgi:tetratricopeptide (TPR) repeat protein